MAGAKDKGKDIFDLPFDFITYNIHIVAYIIIIYCTIIIIIKNTVFTQNHSMVCD